MKRKLELSQIRFKYKEDKLSIKDSNNNPFNQFSKWMNQAIKNKVFEPTAMSLATIDKKKVSNRIVLLKDIKNNTFIFYTNLHSKKAKDLKKNKSIAAVFWWPQIGKQVRIEGKIKKNASIRLLRDDQIIYEGKLNSLKKVKEEIAEVKKGSDCGIVLDNFQDIKQNDIIESYIIEEQKRSL